MTSQLTQEQINQIIDMLVAELPPEIALWVRLGIWTIVLSIVAFMALMSWFRFKSGKDQALATYHATAKVESEKVFEEKLSEMKETTDKIFEVVGSLGQVIGQLTNNQDVNNKVVGELLKQIDFDPNFVENIINVVNSSKEFAGDLQDLYITSAKTEVKRDTSEYIEE